MENAASPENKPRSTLGLRTSGLRRAAALDKPEICLLPSSLWGGVSGLLFFFRIVFFNRLDLAIKISKAKSKPLGLCKLRCQMLVQVPCACKALFFLTS